MLVILALNVLTTYMNVCTCVCRATWLSSETRGPPRAFGEQGKRVFISGNRGNVFISGEQRPNFEGKWGAKTILGNRELKKTHFQIFGNRGTSEQVLPSLREPL